MSLGDPPGWYDHGYWGGDMRLISTTASTTMPAEMQAFFRDVTEAAEFAHSLRSIGRPKVQRVPRGTAWQVTWREFVPIVSWTYNAA